MWTESRFTRTQHLPARTRPWQTELMSLYYHFFLEARHMKVREREGAHGNHKANHGDPFLLGNGLWLLELFNKAL